jgi:hypothetical protein
MKTGKRLGRFLFVIGLAGPLLLYASPQSFPTHEVHAVCPLCTNVEVPFAHPLLWLQIGLAVGLLQGIAFALLGFTVGCFVSEFK